MAKLDPNAVSAGAVRRLPVGAACVAEPAAAPPRAARQAVQKDLEAKLKAAFEQARKDGLEQGQAKAAADYQERLSTEQRALERSRQAIADTESERRRAFSALLDALQQQREQMLAEAEALAVEIAFRAICRLLQVRQDDRTLLGEVCNVAIQELGNSVIRVRIPQAAADLVRTATRPGLEIVVDASLQPEQCLIDTLRGTSEVGLATRLDGLKHALLAELHDGAGGA